MFFLDDDSVMQIGSRDGGRVFFDASLVDLTADKGQIGSAGLADHLNDVLDDLLTVELVHGS